jgi:serine/threonine protein kinase
VAHRDLKAENILLDRHNNVRLIDFSLSKQFSKGAPTLVTVCGSPAYTKAADIWSAGVCLFAMVAGHLPFEDSSVEGLLEKVVSLEPNCPASISRGFVDFLKRFLSKSPNSRITIDRLKEHQWFSHCEYSVLIGFHTTVNGNGDGIPGIDGELVDRMGSLGFDCNDLTRAVLAGEYSRLTAVYKQLRRYKLTDRMKDLVGKMTVSQPTRILLTPLSPDPVMGHSRLQDVCGHRRLTSAQMNNGAVCELIEEMEERPPVRRMSRPMIVKPDAIPA